mmetsp:Transcript_98114/g.248934  ORF Transcript_98114/g.248934 Transcript_98114/m.248934 type:complete len:271 (+) Transcript_98114:166-978(+)
MSSRVLAIVLCVACLASAQNPEEAAYKVAKEFVLGGVLAIQEVAYVEAKKVFARVARQTADSTRAHLKAVDAQIFEAQQVVQDERQREASVNADMASTIERAREVALNDVMNSVDVWSKSDSSQRVLAAEQQELDQSVKTELQAEGLRKEAYSNLEVAATSASYLVELASEAKNIAAGLSRSHAEDVAQSFNERNSHAESQAAQSLRLSHVADKMLKDADASANAALKRSLAAEGGAQKALATARRNTGRIARLKIRAQEAFQKATALAS